VILLRDRYFRHINTIGTQARSILQLGVGFAVADEVVEEDIGVDVEEILLGMYGVSPAHTTKIAVCMKYGRGIFTVARQQKFCPRYCVEQTAAKQYAASA